MKRATFTFMLSIQLLCTFAQTDSITLCFPLQDNLLPTQTGFDPLQLTSNELEMTGQFEENGTILSICPEIQSTQCRYFNDNSGIIFDNGSNEFIEGDYTVELLFNFEIEPNNSLFDPPWVQLVRFTALDEGLFLYKEPDIFGTGQKYLQVWEDGNDATPYLVSIFNDFQTNEWYHLAIVKNGEQIEIYLDGSLVFDFNDSAFSIFDLANGSSQDIVFFQDNPNVLAAEASSGWVSDIHISNFAKTSSEIQSALDCLCSSFDLECNSEPIVEDLFTCDPELAGTQISDSTMIFDCGCTCNSSITFNYVLEEPTETFETLAFCEGDSIQIGNDWYQSPQTVEGIYSTIEGCDSVVTSTLEMFQTYSENVSAIVCQGDSIFIDGEWYEESIDLEIVYQTTQGCDSTITHSITYEEWDNELFFDQENEILISASNGLNYEWMNCDTGEILQSGPSNTLEISSNGNYAVTTTTDNCIFQSECISVEVTSLKEQSAQELNIYPNPFQDFISVAKMDHQPKTISLYDLTGQVVLKEFTSAYKVNLATENLNKGPYFMRIFDRQNELIYQRLLIKN